MDNKKVPDRLLKQVVSDNLSFSFSYKKSEKLTSAIHMITGGSLSSEPLCRLLRERSLDVHSYLCSLGVEVNGALSENLRRIRSSIIEIVSLLGVAYRAGIISQANFSLLESEYADLGMFIERNNDRIRLQYGISETALDVPKSSSVLKAPSSRNVLLDKEHSFSPKKTNGTRHQERRENIISIIKDKGKVSVKDISRVITGCSEKTLQRELSHLVLNGVLKREGERRWSLYSLIES